VSAVELCEGCGAEVAAVQGDAAPVAVDGLMVRAGWVLPGLHLCRDYLAWYGPVDRRDPLTVDVPDCWSSARLAGGRLRQRSAA
jgi:hypothetical protein